MQFNTASAWVLACAVVSSSAHALHQCQDAQGRKVFTDMPCTQAADAPVAPAPTATRPIALPVLTAGQGVPRELVTALYRCLEAASVGSQRQFLECSAPGVGDHQRASQDWTALLSGWRSMLPRRLLAIDARVDAAERNAQLTLVSGVRDQMEQRLSATLVRKDRLWQLVELTDRAAP